MLAEGASLPDATIELTLEEGDSSVRHVFGVHEGRVVGLAEDEPAAREPSVRIGGDRPAWTAALGPRSEARRLRLRGDRRAGERVLAAIAHRTRRGPGSDGARAARTHAASA